MKSKVKMSMNDLFHSDQRMEEKAALNFISKIPDQCGYLVIADGAVIKVILAYLFYEYSASLVKYFLSVRWRIGQSREYCYHSREDGQHSPNQQCSRRPIPTTDSQLRIVPLGYCPRPEASLCCEEKALPTINLYFTLLHLVTFKSSVYVQTEIKH